MSFTRIVTLFILSLLMIGNAAIAQRIDFREARKRSKATDVATIVFKSDFDSLTVVEMSGDSIYKKTDREYNRIWTQYVDLRYERERGDTIINRRYVLHTPYTLDREIVVPSNGEDLQQSIYEYKVRVFDFFPLRISFETDIVRMKDYFGFRVSLGKKWGGYLSAKFGDSKNGFNADERGDIIDTSKKTFVGRIRNSYMAGVKYGIASRDYPIYVYFGAGYGDNGYQRSNGKKKDQGRIDYYNDYTCGFESELGANFVLFDFLSISMGADVILDHRVSFDINCTIGFAVDLTQ